MLRIRPRVRRLRRRAAQLVLAAAGIAAVVAALPAMGPAPWSDHNGAVHASPSGQRIADLLADVDVVAELPDVAGYERGCKRGQRCSFGAAWNDPTDHSGCDTRNRMLQQQLTEVVIKPGTHGCKVLAGTLEDPYTGQVVAFSAADPDAVQVDHVFALARAWDAGAWRWDQAQRIAFANDPANLIVVTGPANRDKSDSGLQWLPPNTAYRCTYIARYLSVAADYDLAITGYDRDIALTQCPSVAERTAA